MKIYLAGPDVFRENAIEHGNLLKSICKGFGYKGLFPLDNECDSPKEIFNSNFNMIRDCDAVIANAEPFRGPSMDVGTAWEVGAAKALGKTVILYNCSNTDYKHRVSWDREFPGIEDFGLKDNLMLIMCADKIVDSFFDALDYLKGF